MSEINIIRDISAIIAEEYNYKIKIEIDNFELGVYLIYNPDDDFEDDFKIPILFDALYEAPNIDIDKLHETFKQIDIGIDHRDIKIIDRIMDYIEDNSQEIIALMRELNPQEDEEGDDLGCG